MAINRFVNSTSKFKKKFNPCPPLAPVVFVDEFSPIIHFNNKQFDISEGKN